MLTKNFIIDEKSLAITRIGLCLVVFIDLLLMWEDRFWFWGSDGLLSDTDATRYWSETWITGPYQFLTSDGFLTPMLCLHLGILISLMAGYKTRLATLLLWIFTQSLQARNPLILQGFDLALRVLLFWAIFLPWGRRLSLDSFKTSNASSQRKWQNSYVPALWVSQIAMIYFFTGLSKSIHSPWWNGSAVIDALSLEHLTWGVSPFLRSLPSFFYQIAASGTLAAELLIAPSVILLKRNLRNSVVAIMILFHLGLGLCFTLGPFSPAMIFVWLSLYLPSRQSKNVNILPPSKYSGATFALVAVFLLTMNFSTFRGTWPEWMYFKPLSTLRLGQSWLMFDNPSDQPDGWFVALDLFSQTPVPTKGSGESFEKPALVSSTYASHRWVKWMMGVARQNSWTFDGTKRYFCHHHKLNQTSPGILDLYFMERIKPSDYYEKRMLLSFQCEMP